MHGGKGVSLVSLGRPGQLRQWWWSTARSVRAVPAAAAIALAACGITTAHTELTRPDRPPATGPGNAHTVHRTDAGTPCRWHGAVTHDTTGPHLLTCSYQQGLLQWTDR